jgi:hypothetical protein
MLEIKKIKPIGSQVLVTKNLYGWDDFDAGLIVHKRGDLKSYQEVIAVGDDVKFVKPGDTVEINFYKYCVFENDENSVKVNGTNKVISLRLNEVDLVGEDEEPVSCFLIDQRDIRYIIEDYAEVTFKKGDNTKIIVEPPKKKLILPDKDLKL